LPLASIFRENIGWWLIPILFKNSRVFNGFRSRNIFRWFSKLPSKSLSQQWDTLNIKYHKVLFLYLNFYMLLEIFSIIEGNWRIFFKIIICILISIHFCLNCKEKLLFIEFYYCKVVSLIIEIVSWCR
jgi:hypothetical protein